VDELSFQETFTIFPNPISSNSLLEYTLIQSSPVTIQILDVSGQVIETVINEIQHEGVQKVVFDGSGLKPGVYFCTLKTKQGIQTAKLIKL